MLKTLETSDGEFCSQYKSVQLVSTGEDFDRQKLNVLQGLVDAMKKRYSDMSSSILSSTTLADFKTWPANIEGELQGLHVVNIICFSLIKYLKIIN